MTDNQSYYAIIPADVRYDKAVPANAKLLYGEITALCNKHGYCWATNSYFAELYGVTKKSISGWISILVERGYITSEIKYKDGTPEIQDRYLRICVGGMEKKRTAPMEKKVKENITSQNITLNTTYEDIKADKPPRAMRFTPPTFEEVQAYCTERKNNVDPERFIDFYASKGWMVGKNKMKDWKAAVRNWESRDKANKPQTGFVYNDSYEPGTSLEV